MAPANGSSKSRKVTTTSASASTSTGSGTVVGQANKSAPKKPSVLPALPLPYIKRQATPVSSLASTSNASSNKKKSNKKKNEAVAAQTGDNQSANSSLAVGQESSVEATGTAQAENPQLTNTTSTEQDHNQAATENISIANGAAMNDDSPNTNINIAAQHPQQSDYSTPSRPSGTKTKSNASSSNNSKARAPSSMSPARYQMPPPFHPSNRPLHFPGNGDMHRGHPGHPGPMHNGHRHSHQPHPSNSSIHLGTFHESQTSSPAPPHSGGIAPPPGIGMPDGRQQYMGHGASGFPPMMHYGAEMMPVPGFDNYGRPSVGFQPMESYPAFQAGFGPSGPHSFHGSQSSNADESAMYNNHYGRGPQGSSRPGTHGDNTQAQNGGPRMHPFPDHHHMIPTEPISIQGDQGDDINHLVDHIRSQFGNTALADCTLELRYLDDRSAPVRIPGHRILFSRNAKLSALIQQQALPPSPTGNSMQTLLVETDSKWIRSDSFYMAAQSLYGLPMLPLPDFKMAIESGEFADAGSIVDKLDFALSYAAAGHLLECLPLLRRGTQVARHLINWQTIERVLEFALEDFGVKGLNDSYKYGDGSNILLEGAVTFIVQNFPPTFELDATVAEPVQYARLPIQPAPAPAPAALLSENPDSSEPKPLPVEDGIPSVQLGRGRRSQKITNIQFGDLAISDSRPAIDSVTPKASQQAHPVSHAILSRILLNIPFTQLKMIMESSGSGNVHGWANAESRYQIVKRAVEERESLRQRSLQTVLGGNVPNYNSIINDLSSPETSENGRWAVLGWTEEMLPYGNLDGPSLGRKWTPLYTKQQSTSDEPVPEYP